MSWFSNTPKFGSPILILENLTIAKNCLINADWKHFSAWCRRQQRAPLPASPQVIGLYITACASGAATADRESNTVSRIERSPKAALPGRGAPSIALIGTFR
jgi:hypothetical protein